MPSPFPGMNPYLERAAVWHDFHEQFLPYAREIIAAQVRPKYLVKLDEHVFIHERSAAERRLMGRGDLTVAERLPAVGSATAAAAVVAPAYGELPLAVDEERLSFLEILDREAKTVVTVVELLSPSNKLPGADREQYLGKRRALLRSGVHLVEIDLLRGGARMPVESLPNCDYCVLVSRGEERPRVGLWPIQLREPLPIIPIPLRHPDADAQLDLQALIHRLYDAAGYEDYVYESPPEPRLKDADAEWANAFAK